MGHLFRATSFEDWDNRRGWRSADTFHCIVWYYSPRMPIDECGMDPSVLLWDVGSHTHTNTSVRSSHIRDETKKWNEHGVWKKAVCIVCCHFIRCGVGNGGLMGDIESRSVLQHQSTDSHTFECKTKGSQYIEGLAFGYFLLLYKENKFATQRTQPLCCASSIIPWQYRIIYKARHVWFGDNEPNYRDMRAQKKV